MITATCARVAVPCGSKRLPDLPLSRPAFCNSGYSVLRVSADAYAVGQCSCTAGFLNLGAGCGQIVVHDHRSLLTGDERIQIEMRSVHAGNDLVSCCPVDVCVVVHFAVYIGKLDKAQLLRLTACKYIDEGHHVVLEGASGNGKTYIACALGNAACSRMKTVCYIRMPELLDELDIARSNGSLKKLMKAYKKVELKVREGGVVSPTRRQLLSALLQALFTMLLYCVKVSLKLHADAALFPIYAPVQKNYRLVFVPFSTTTDRE